MSILTGCAGGVWKSISFCLFRFYFIRFVTFKYWWNLSKCLSLVYSTQLKSRILTSGYHDQAHKHPLKLASCLLLTPRQHDRNAVFGHNSLLAFALVLPITRMRKSSQVVRDQACSAIPVGKPSSCGCCSVENTFRLGSLQRDRSPNKQAQIDFRELHCWPIQQTDVRLNGSIPNSIDLYIHLDSLER